MSSSRAVPVVAAILLLCLPLGVQAEPVGRVIMTVGPVVAVDRDDRERAISRHDAIYEGETVFTRAPRGRAQIRFRDDGLVRLQPGTEFNIEEYREPDADGEGGSAVMNLVTGALRKISGGIGRRDGDQYEMKTPTATVGIRGTDYSLQYCDAGCAGEGRQLGVYGRVDDGAVTVENEFGMQEFGNGDYFFVPDDGPPSRVLMPPSGVFDDSEEDDGEADDDDSEEGEGEADDNSEEGDDEADDDGEGDDETAAGASDDEGTEGESAASDNGDDGEGDTALSDDGDDGFESDTGNVFESGDTVTEGLQGTTDSAVAFARSSLLGDGSLDGGLSRSAGLTLQRDAGLVVAVDSDGKTIDAAAAFRVDSGETLGVEWGYWDLGEGGGEFTIDEAVFTDGVLVFAAADSNLTTPDQLAGIGGTLQFGLGPDGPLVALGENDLYGIEQFDITLDLGDMTGTLDVFSLSNFFNDVDFVNQSLTLDDDGGFSGSGLTGTYDSAELGMGDAFAELDGVLLGESADGSLIAFEVELDVGNRISGISILDAEAYGDLQSGGGGGTIPDIIPQ